MRQSTKIDNSLKERRAILDLLERLRCDAVSVEEMEQIGFKLRREGRRALRPLLRELSRECSAELMAKYAYVLDFFESDLWLDQLIKIAVRRRDLDTDARTAILIALEGHGIDVHGPPFRSEGGASAPLSQTAQRAIRVGDEGIISYLDDFLSYPAEAQQMVIRELPSCGDPQAARMLEALMWHDDPVIVRGALEALGRIRDPLAAEVLVRYLENGNPEFVADARRSLRRLSFLRIEQPQPQPPLPFHAGYATPPDGDGYRSLVITRWAAEGRVAVLYMQVHERRGMLAAWGAGSLTEEELQAELDAFCVQDDLQRVAPGYVLELLRDALYWSRELCHLPADFYLRRSMFSGVDLTPSRYRPSFSELPEGRLLTYSEGEDISRELFDDPFFAGWFLASERVHDYALEFRRRASREQVLERFCAELLAPELELICDRLLLIADLMHRCGRGDDMAARVVALASTLEANPLPHHLHPFLRGFALESLETAREALEQGNPELMQALEEVY